MPRTPSERPRYIQNPVIAFCIVPPPPSPTGIDRIWPLFVDFLPVPYLLNPPGELPSGLSDVPPVVIINGHLAQASRTVWYDLSLQLMLHTRPLPLSRYVSMLCLPGRRLERRATGPPQRQRHSSARVRVRVANRDRHSEQQAAGDALIPVHSRSRARVPLAWPGGSSVSKRVLARAGSSWPANLV